jgi:hypothetical protein
MKLESYSQHILYCLSDIFKKLHFIIHDEHCITILYIAISFAELAAEPESLPEPELQSKLFISF